MQIDFSKYLNEYTSTGLSDEQSIIRVESTFKIILPDDFRRFHDTIGSGEGFLGDQYLVIWSADEILSFNAEYQVNTYAPGLMLFGSNGGGEGIAFDLRDASLPVVIIPLIGMDLCHVILASCSFTGLLDRLKHGDLLF